MANDPISLASEDDRRTTARRLWTRLEAVHTLGYFAPQVATAQKALGMRGWVMGYTAGRVAPLGPVGPEIATAVFHNFSPTLLARAIPEAWTIAAPDQVLIATRGAVGEVLAPMIEGIEDDVARAAELAREAALGHPTLGRPLAAARSALPWPETPELVLWEAATRVRESRGDGHVACLVEAGLDGVEAHLTLVGDRPKLRARMGPMRGWTEGEWDAGAARLRERGLLAGDGSLTVAGQALRDHLERRTDELVVDPWSTLGEAGCEQLRRAIRPLVRRIVDADVLPGLITRRVES